MRKSLPKTLRVLILTASPILFFCLLLSISALMLRWRVIHEPGAHSSQVRNLTLIFWGLLGLGTIGSGTVAALMIRFREKYFWIALILDAAAVVFYIPIFMITLFMMV